MWMAPKKVLQLLPLLFPSIQALYDCFEETIRELRLQLRQKEALENFSSNLKEVLNQRDAELDAFKSENEALKKQKDALMKAFGYVYQREHGCGTSW